MDLSTLRAEITNRQGWHTLGKCYWGLFGWS